MSVQVIKLELGRPAKAASKGATTWYVYYLGRDMGGYCRILLMYLSNVGYTSYELTVLIEQKFYLEPLGAYYRVKIIGERDEFITMERVGSVLK